MGNITQGSEKGSQRGEGEGIFNAIALFYVDLHRDSARLSLRASGRTLIGLGVGTKTVELRHQKVPW